MRGSGVLCKAPRYTPYRLGRPHTLSAGYSSPTPLPPAPLQGHGRQRQNKNQRRSKKIHAAKRPPVCWLPGSRPSWVCRLSSVCRSSWVGRLSSVGHLGWVT
ncbi:hypothetical protein FKM82_026890 [Ascaphus truei]